MYSIKKEFHFSASHQLRGLAEDHPCTRLHGHNYVIEIELRSLGLNDVGFVKDYRELDEFKKWLDSTFDHQHINDRMQQNPSAENMAKFIYSTWFPKFNGLLVSVTVKETPKTAATYYE